MLELVKLAEPLDHAEAFGRIAFSCPRAEVATTHVCTQTTECGWYTQLPEIERRVKEAGGTIITPLVSLDTPGKATVEVVILADPVSEPHHKLVTAELDNERLFLWWNLL